MEYANEGPPAAAFAALTASSMLQHLDISYCMLPPGVWQHVFLAGRQLPHLQLLDISCVTVRNGRIAAAPEGTRLAACCPGMQSLTLKHLQYSADLLAALKGLGGLHTLHLATEGKGKGLGVVGQLTGLRELHLDAANSTKGLFLELSQLQQLTSLAFTGHLSGYKGTLWLTNTVRFDVCQWENVCNSQLSSLLAACLLACMHASFASDSCMQEYVGFILVTVTVVHIFGDIAVPGSAMCTFQKLTFMFR
jgi:hypothetical protein